MQALQQAASSDFNPRSHEGSDIFFSNSLSIVVVFQSTLPRGERPGSYGAVGQFSGNFNPRSHEGSDYILRHMDEEHYNFNPRSHEGSDGEGRPPFFPIGDFNPRSHEGSDTVYCSGSRNGYISIHAPTRGATISFHISLIPVIFQSTLPRGERQEQVFVNHVFTLISIHAPTRGATSLCKSFQNSYPNFNPRSHEGSDALRLSA